MTQLIFLADAAPVYAARHLMQKGGLPWGEILAVLLISIVISSISGSCLKKPLSWIASGFFTFLLLMLLLPMIATGTETYKISEAGWFSSATFGTREVVLWDSVWIGVVVGVALSIVIPLKIGDKK